MSTSSSLHCVTCNQPLPEGKEPEYFGQGSIGYEAETEITQAAEDVSQFLRYAQTVTSSLWNMIQVADVNPPELLDPECYLDDAHFLCFLLTDLVHEAERRVETLSRLVDEKLKKEQDITAIQRKEGK